MGGAGEEAAGRVGERTALPPFFPSPPQSETQVVGMLGVLIICVVPPFAFIRLFILKKGDMKHAMGTVAQPGDHCIFFANKTKPFLDIFCWLKFYVHRLLILEGFVFNVS